MSRDTRVSSNELLVEFTNNRRLIDLCGAHDQNLNQIENQLGIQIVRRGNKLLLYGDPDAQEAGERVLRNLYDQLELGSPLRPGDADVTARLEAQRSSCQRNPDASGADDEGLTIRTRRRVIAPRTRSQAEFVLAIRNHQMVFGMGPAGTGKTYLAVAEAVSMLTKGQVDRIVLCRPAVEAGERLGFLPGDMKEKVDPYMQPLYDALRDFLHDRQIQKYLERKVIEIAPLAFMRGRTLSSSFVVFDEAQNVTEMQMKMLLTRIGADSRMVINGDISQIDLPRGVNSGLVQARKVLSGVKGIAFREFGSKDVVRHNLVARIIEAYAEEA